MANDYATGLLSNPLFGLGIGLLSGGQPGGTMASGMQQGLLNMQAMQRQESAMKAQAQQQEVAAAQIEEIQRTKDIREKQLAMGMPSMIGQPAQPALQELGIDPMQNMGQPQPYVQPQGQTFPGEQPIPGLSTTGQPNQPVQTAQAARPATGLEATNPMAAELYRRQWQDYPVETNRQMLEQMFAKPVQGTTAARNLQEAGYIKGTEPYQEAMKRYMAKTTGTTVNVGGGSKMVPFKETANLINPKTGETLPPGSTEADVVSGGYKYRPEAERKEARKAWNELATAGNAMTEYKSLLQEHGTEQWHGQGKLMLGSAYTDLLMQAKELAKLGVLSGPDLELMQKQLYDPTKVSLYSGSDLLAQLSLYEKKIGNAWKQAIITYGLPPSAVKVED